MRQAQLALCSASETLIGCTHRFSPACGSSFQGSAKGAVPMFCDMVAGGNQLSRFLASDCY